MALEDKQKSKKINNWIPTEIILEILLKLPVESLLRCKSVCKEWYSLISDQSFIKTHYTLSSTKINHEHHRLIYNIYKQGNDFISCPVNDVLFDESANNELVLENPIQQTRGFTIAGSCNGLMCLIAFDHSMFIYNPSTRTTNILPRPKQGARWVLNSMVLGMMGRLMIKVVKIWCCDKTSRYWGAMTYSLKAGSWKEIGRFPWVNPFHDGKFFNGALYWPTSDCGSWHIVSLDLGKETYSEVLQPEYDGEGYKTLTMGVLGESLCVLCDYCESCVVDVWVMKVYGVKDSWTKLACIPYPTNPMDTYTDLDILCILKDGKVLLRFGPLLLVCDPKNSSSLEIVNFDEIHEACIVVESLVSPIHP